MTAHDGYVDIRKDKNSIILIIRTDVTTCTLYINGAGVRSVKNSLQGLMIKGEYNMK